MLPVLIGVLCGAVYLWVILTPKKSEISDSDRFKILCEEYCAIPIDSEVCMACFKAFPNNKCNVFFYPCDLILRSNNKHFSNFALLVCTLCRTSPMLEHQLSTSLRWLVENNRLNFFAKG